MNSTQKAKILIPGNLPMPFWYDASHLKLGHAAPGKFARVSLNNQVKTGIITEIKTVRLPFKTKKILGIIPAIQLSPDWLGLVDWMSGYYSTPASKVLSTAIPGFVFQQFCREKPLIDSAAAAEPAGNVSEPQNSFIPTPEQRDALTAILPCLNKKMPGFESFLLKGITGSGKTLVYLHCIKKCLEQKKSAIMLLPEIALTPQILTGAKQFLNQSVLACHSNLTAGQKRQLWQAVFSGQPVVIIGVRSAVLCPVTNPGLIIVDEEHDSSYKQSETAPRYNARDMALFRGKQEGFPVILGSATPSMESYFASLNNRHKLIQMNHRATNSPLPEVRIVDMRAQFELQGDAPLSIPLRDAMTQALKQHEQVILLLNRRGYARRRLCKACGKPQECPNCIAPLIPHRDRNKMVCHYCQHSETTEFHCPACGYRTSIDAGLAIEKMEEILTALYPDHRILRLDRDSARKKESANRIISLFRNGEADILLGTQMVAKGHDFPRVNVVGVIDADTGLGLPDFRAQERTFQLITQVAGRAGRHSERGTVFIQTFRPDNPALNFALNQNYSGFYNSELQLRTELHYPPVTRMVKIAFSGTKEKQVQDQIQLFSQILQKIALSRQIRLLGPGQAIYKKIGGRFRSQIFGKCVNPMALHRAVQESLKQFNPHHIKSVQIHIDPDPVSLL